MIAWNGDERDHASLDLKELRYFGERGTRVVTATAKWMTLSQLRSDDTRNLI
ncbi:MAG: hypothetical protein MK110_11405 [Fuerstiella sp.]|nr:hypothetical protein [Fuerstiella sp.]